MMIALAHADRARELTESTTVSSRDVNRDLSVIYLAAVITRLVLGTLAWLLLRRWGISLLEDAMYYERLGFAVAQDWLAGRSSHLIATWFADRTHPWLMPGIVGLVYYMCGGARLTGVLVISVSLITALAPIVFYKLTLELGGSSRAARISGFLVALSPCFAFFGGSSFKDGFVILLCGTAILYTARLARAFQWRSALIVAVVLLLISGLRFYLLPFLALPVLFAATLPFRRSAGILPRAMVAAAAIAGTSILVSHNFPHILKRPNTVAQFIAKGRLKLSTKAQSSYLSAVDLSSPGKVVRFIPRGSAYFLMVPAPWHIGSFRQNLVLPETAFWILLYPLMCYGALRARKLNPAVTYLVLSFSLMLVLLYGVYIGNMGTAYRLRSQVWALWSVFAGIGLDRALARRLKSNREINKPQNLEI